jgi:dCTP deaminase
MSILTRDVILELFRSGEIEIDPYSPDLVGPASIDLRLANSFRVFRNVRKTYDVSESSELDEITELVHVPDGEHLMLMPGRSCLGITVERIKLPPNICGWLQGRSRFARLGLVIHSTASFIHPGIDNKQVLEILNSGQIPLNLYPGVALCQIILQECVGSAHYGGTYSRQLKL